MLNVIPLQETERSAYFEVVEAKAVLLEWGCKHRLAQVCQTSDENQKGLKLVFVDVYLMKQQSRRNRASSNRNLIFSSKF